ncbi:MAG: hypothetical protein H8E40_10255 [Chloroflexi bacterium]|nr:hypothetical protein [Chloroflexota bacterium]
MGSVRWLVYILSFFIPAFGFVTFWVFSGKADELKDVGKGAMIASFFGIVLYLILAALGVTVFSFLWRGMGIL